MDSLFQQAKQMYPNASDQEIEQGLAQIRAKAPEASDQEILQAASKIQSAQQDGSFQTSMMKESLKQKYGLGDYSPEARQKLVDNVQTSGSPIAAAFAGFGAGLRGGDVGGAFNNAMNLSQQGAKDKLAAFDQARKTKQEDFDFEQKLGKADKEAKDLADLEDPSSDVSKAYQDAAIKRGLSPELAAKMSGKLLKDRLPFLEKEAEQDYRKKRDSIEDSRAERAYKDSRSDAAIDRDLREREFDLRKKAENSKDQNEKAKLQMQADELAQKRQAMGEGAKGKPTEGQKVVDREFAKDYNEWTSGGSKNARQEIDKLDGVVKDLEAGKTSTGALTGHLPDALTSNELLKARSSVQSTVMNSLRSILGAQFTEKEGERIIKNTWNEQDSTENNINRLKNLVQSLKNQADDKDQKSSYYEQKGTLQGYKAGNTSPNQEQKSSGKRQF